MKREERGRKPRKLSKGEILLISFWEGQEFFSFLELDVMQRRREKFRALVVKGTKRKNKGERNKPKQKKKKKGETIKRKMEEKERENSKRNLFLSTCQKNI